MLHPRVLFLGDPAAAAPYVGIAKKLARETFAARIRSKTYKVGEATIRVENTLPAKETFGEGYQQMFGGICKVWIEAGGGIWYQFITTGTEIILDDNGSYKGSAVAVKLPVPKVGKIVDLSKIKPIATGSTIESLPTDPPTNPSDDTNKISRVKGIAQVQLIPEPVFYYSQDLNNPSCTQLQFSQASMNGVIYNAGLYMLAPAFISTDKGYDSAPTTIKGRAINPRMPDADWPHDACLVSVSSTQYGSRTFIIMVDASNKFYCWPTIYDNSFTEYLFPNDSPYISQAIKTNVDEAQVKRVTPSFPSWAHVPVGQRRDTDWPSDVNSGEPRYVWRFHPQGTKVVGTVLERNTFVENVYGIRGHVFEYITAISHGSMLYSAQYGMILPYCPLWFDGSGHLQFEIASFTVNVGANRRVIIRSGDYITLVIMGYIINGLTPGTATDADSLPYLFACIANEDIDITTPISGVGSVTINVNRAIDSDDDDNPYRASRWYTYVGMADVVSQISLDNMGPLKVNPAIKDSFCSTNNVDMIFDSPGMVEYSLSIEITGENKEDFSFSMAELVSIRADDDNYIINSAYLSPCKNVFSGYALSASIGELLSANIEIYIDSEEEAHELRYNLGYTDDLANLCRKTIINIKNVSTGDSYIKFITLSQPSGYQRTKNRVDGSSYFIYSGKLAHIDLSTLSFIYVVNKDTFSITDTTLDFIKQQWITRTTGVRVYCFGKVVYETSDFAWSDLADELDVTDLVKAEYSKTGTRYVRETNINNLVNLLASYLGYEVTRSYLDGGHTVYPSINTRTEEGIRSCIRAAKDSLYEDNFIGHSQHIYSLSEEQLDNYFLSANQEYDKEIWNNQVVDRLLELQSYINSIGITLGYGTSRNTILFYLSTDYKFITTPYAEMITTFPNMSRNVDGLVTQGFSQERVHNYPIGKELFMKTWNQSVEVQAGRQLAVSPYGYYSVYRKQPIINTTIANNILFYKQGDKSYKFPVLNYSTKTISVFSIYNKSYGIDNSPSRNSFSYETIDLVGHCDYTLAVSHQTLYEQAFNKETGSGKIDDPSIAVSFSSTIGTYLGTTQTYYKYNVEYTTNGTTKSFFNDYNPVMYSRLNGSMLFSE